MYAYLILSQSLQKWRITVKQPLIQWSPLSSWSYAEWPPCCIVTTGGKSHSMIQGMTCLFLSEFKVFSDWMRWRDREVMSQSPLHPIRECIVFTETNTRPTLISSRAVQTTPLQQGSDLSCDPENHNYQYYLLKIQVEFQVFLLHSYVTSFSLANQRMPKKVCSTQARKVCRLLYAIQSSAL